MIEITVDNQKIDRQIMTEIVDQDTGRQMRTDTVVERQITDRQITVMTHTV